MNVVQDTVGITTAMNKIILALIMGHLMMGVLAILIKSVSLATVTIILANLNVSLGKE